MGTLIILILCGMALYVVMHWSYVEEWISKRKTANREKERNKALLHQAYKSRLESSYTGVDGWGLSSTSIHKEVKRQWFKEERIRKEAKEKEKEMADE